MATLMRSLSGDGSLALGTGALRGLDLAGMIRTLDLSHQGAGAQTVFDGVTAGFTIADGVLSNADLVLDAPWGQVMGQGRVDLGAQQLNYRLTPRVSTGGDGSTIRVPILVSGPWSAPVIRPDLAYLAEQELAVERAKLEAEAQARLDAERARLETEARARANALLGTDLGPDSTLDDARGAVEQRLREEAEQQLLRLLGRGN
jgi:AsmA protein